MYPLKHIRFERPSLTEKYIRQGRHPYIGVMMAFHREKRKTIAGRCSDGIGHEKGSMNGDGGVAQYVYL